MKLIDATAILFSLFVSVGCFAAAPPDAPAGATGLCKDGTYYTGAEKKGACKGHKGVKDWYADAPTAKTDAKSASTKTAAGPAMTTPAATTSAQASKTSAPPAEAAPGGGPGKVWANESSKVYHCMGDKWYGKTKHGEYISEADAKAKGYKPDHGKACQS